MMKDKVFVLQIIEKGTNNMLSSDVIISRELQMSSSEKKLFEVYDKEMIATLTRMLKNPHLKEMLLR